MTSTDINSINSHLLLLRSFNNINISNTNSTGTDNNSSSNNNNNSNNSNSNSNGNISQNNNIVHNSNNSNNNIKSCSNNNNNNNQKKKKEILDYNLNFTNRIIRSNIIKNINFLKNSVENYFINNGCNSGIYRDGSAATSICDLPDEIIIYIFKYLSPFDLRICCLVSTYWSHISSLNTLWYDKCLSQWYWLFNIGEEKNKRLPNSTWKEFYKYWAKEYLNHTEWWQESFTREDAERALSTQGKGTFLIRTSTSKKNCLVISYNAHAQHPTHMLLSYLGIYTGVSLYDEIGRIYPTLASLVRGKKSWLKRPFQSCGVYASKSKSKLQFIERMLNDPKERDGKTIDQLSLLHIACKWSFKQLVVALLEKGANINHKCDCKGKPPLFFAIEFVHGQPSNSVRLEILRILLKNENINVNQLDNKGRSILHVATKQHQQDSPEMLKLLLNYGADPLISSPSGLYPLHVAVKENNIKMLKILLNLEKDSVKTLPTTITTTTSIIDVKLDNQDINQNNNQTNIINTNCTTNSNSLKKINVNCKIELTPISKLNDDYGSTPLHIASSKNYFSIIKLLLEHPEIQVDCLDNKNRTPLHRAVLNTQDWVNMARFGKPLQHHFSHQIIEILLKNKADPNLMDCENKTPLHIAVEKGHRKSAHGIATSVRDLFTHEKVQSIYSKESLLQSLNAGRESKDIQKIVADVNYSIMCGYNEDFNEPLDKTIIDHYNNINDILKKEFLHILK
ncbi:hypothetical protein DICPUDRAFT_153549 [Dictyostelium purpureum]|uniref:Ankyrin repeat-containing protein n=1 Tax=Dictyostelium purpureum TaxID=5786 RepID=F0ZP70_DICPU|nr:uncharacterized protein DICPUDRAFT_153549 [Dictyostelium purpureum]EGC34253.1 hypothetical protein DICPUDRAFT_153549 [Dictyostelium purpureum]|eukprot:XP_003289222.1 hypothetical protein DICPUDRAFT_153549 [Dictyostelium purpureum]